MRGNRFFILPFFLFHFCAEVLAAKLDCSGLLSVIVQRQRLNYRSELYEGVEYRIADASYELHDKSLDHSVVEPNVFVDLRIDSEQSIDRIAEVFSTLNSKESIKQAIVDYRAKHLQSEFVPIETIFPAHMKENLYRQREDINCLGAAFCSKGLIVESDNVNWTAAFADSNLLKLLDTRYARVSEPQILKPGDIILYRQWLTHDRRFEIHHAAVALTPDLIYVKNGRAPASIQRRVDNQNHYLKRPMYGDVYREKGLLNDTAERNLGRRQALFVNEDSEFAFYLGVDLNGPPRYIEEKISDLTESRSLLSPDELRLLRVMELRVGEGTLVSAIKTLVAKHAPYENDFYYYQAALFSPFQDVAFYKAVLFNQLSYSNPPSDRKIQGYAFIRKKFPGVYEENFKALEQAFNIQIQ